MAFLEAYVTRSALLACSVLGIVVTILFAALRIYVRISRQGRLHADDYALLCAAVLYWILAALYIVDLPFLYAFLDYASGKVAYSSELPDDYHHMMLISFGVTALLWCVLWTVKISLLLFFRRIILGTDWMRAWWCIFGFVVVTFIGCIISELTSCDHISDFTALGACISPRNQRAQIISLYYSFAADVLTELAVLALPIYVVLNLQLSRKDKWYLVGIFSVGLFTIAVSMIRVFLIWAKTHSATPSPAWLALWAIIEGMIAIIDGCIPAFSQIIRQHAVDRNGRSLHLPRIRGREPAIDIPVDSGLASSCVGRHPGSSEEDLVRAQPGIFVHHEVHIQSEKLA